MSPAPLRCRGPAPGAGVLPADLVSVDLPHWVIGVVGFVLFLSGSAVVAYQLTRPKPLD